MNNLKLMNVRSERVAPPKATLLLGVALAFIGLLGTTNAAEIEIEDGEACELSLSGPIIEGDSERLQLAVLQLIDQTPEQDRWGRAMRLCLDSPGGSLEEGARIARLVREWGLATRIEADKQCLSACSWVFMLGKTDQMWGELRGEYDYIDRSMASTATLGFHAPLLPLGNAPTIRTADAQRGYRVLTAAFAEILSLAYSPEERRGLIDSDLLLQAMLTPPTPDDFFFIDTVDKAGRWNIRVSDIGVPSPLSAEARDERRLLRVQKQMAGVKLLIIDELGFVPLSKTGAELLFELISQRYERASTMITSNLPFDEWTETFGTERLTGALLDRLTHHVNILEMNGDSYRLGQSRARKAEANT